MTRECQICYSNFDINKHQPRIFGKCGHTICLECLNKIIIETRIKSLNMIKWLLYCPWDRSWYLMDEKTGNEIFPLNRVFYDDLVSQTSKNNSYFFYQKEHKNNQKSKEKKKILNNEIFIEDYGYNLLDEKNNRKQFFDKFEKVEKSIENINNISLNSWSIFDTTTRISKDNTSPIINKNRFIKKINNNLSKKNELKSIKKINLLSKLESKDKISEKLNGKVKKNIFDNTINKLKNVEFLKNDSVLLTQVEAYQKKTKSRKKNANEVLKDFIRMRSNSKSKKSIKSRSNSKIKIKQIVTEINQKFKKIFREKSNSAKIKEENNQKAPFKTSINSEEYLIRKKKNSLQTTTLIKNSQSLTSIKSKSDQLHFLDQKRNIIKIDGNVKKIPINHRTLSSPQFSIESEIIPSNRISIDNQYFFSNTPVINDNFNLEYDICPNSNKSNDFSMPLSFNKKLTPSSKNYYEYSYFNNNSYSNFFKTSTQNFPKNPVSNNSKVLNGDFNFPNQVKFPSKPF